MPFRRGRIVEPEYLDHESPERAEPSLRDLVRINRMLGGHRVLREALAECVAGGGELSMLDVGSASGDAARVAREQYPGLRVTSLDYKANHLSGASGDRVLADAFRMPFAPRAFDVVYCGLFLHHFQNQQVVDLLRSFGSLARRFVVVNDLERHFLAYYFLPATRPVFGWDPITLHDGPVSVQAAFTGAELSELGRAAGLRNVTVRRYRPAFRLLLIAEASDTLTT
jgi:2-polyprenyl-3-methyl-5-hydroxy-6-metoxy-1,4-benzoquinol methylase